MKFKKSHPIGEYNYTHDEEHIPPGFNRHNNISGNAAKQCKQFNILNTFL
jgi:hypothetical protein